MDWKRLYDPKTLDAMADSAFAEQKQLKRLDGWFLIREIVMENTGRFETLHPEVRAARLLECVAQTLPLSLGGNAVFAGTQNDAFARSYALINPGFKVETFEGYCDPVAVFNDIEPNNVFTPDRIGRVRDFCAATPYVRELRKAYASVAQETREVAFFVEQVTGHVIPDFRPILKHGIARECERIREKIAATADPDKKATLEGMAIALQAAATLASRYADCARAGAAAAAEPRKSRLLLLE